MVDVICDTSFLITLATKSIKNIDNLDYELGQIQFVIPKVVKNELENLCKDKNKKTKALHTLDFIKKFKTISILGNFADESILSHVKMQGGLIATIDKQLKKKVKDLGGSIISLANDRIVLEP